MILFYELFLLFNCLCISNNWFSHRCCSVGVSHSELDHDKKNKTKVQKSYAITHHVKLHIYSLQLQKKITTISSSITTHINYPYILASSKSKIYDTKHIIIHPLYIHISFNNIQRTKHLIIHPEFTLS